MKVTASFFQILNDTNDTHSLRRYFYCYIVDNQCFELLDRVSLVVTRPLEILIFWAF